MELDELVETTTAANRQRRSNHARKEVIENEKVTLPTPGKSSGDTELDSAVRRWRLTNTEDDERLKELFQQERDVKKLRQSRLGMMEMEDRDETDADEIAEFMVQADDMSQYVSAYNKETGEINGPKGPEPTRYGDWERKGRVSDF